MHITKNKVPSLMIVLLLLLFMPVVVFAEAPETPEITIPNTPVKGLIQIEKQGPVLQGFNEHRDPFGNTVHTPIYGNGWLEGAVFEIRAVEDIVGKDGTVWFKANGLADTVVTSGGKTADSRLLPLGHYYVTEVSAPDGYYFEKTRYDVVLEARDHDTPVVSIGVIASNDFRTTRISLVKEKEVLYTQKDSSGMIRTVLANEPAEGFVFGLCNEQQIDYAAGSLPADTLIATAVTDKNGRLTFSGKFPVGVYYLKEISGPEGWVLDTAHHRVSIPADSKIVDNEMTVSLETPVINHLFFTEVRISKTDLTGSDYLPHTMIEIRNAAGETVLRDYTGEDGYLPAFRAVPGDYTYREVLAPEGYELCTTEFSFRVTADGRVDGKTSVSDDFTRFTVRKEDPLCRPLCGVEFSLFREDGSLQAKAVTDSEGLATFEKIPYGTYTVRETKALPGYLKNDTAAAITIDGTFVNPEEPIAVFTNCESEILIRKVDQNEAALQGAEFGLYDESGKLVMTAVSDAEGLVRFTGAAYGRYAIRELSAPDGYLANHDVIYITIDDGYTNSDTPAATVMDSEKKIMCIKTDTSGNPIPGIEFSLYNASTMELVETAISDKDGVFTFRSFDYGDWIIRETAAPEGFCRMEDVWVHVNDGWTGTVPVMCVNIPDHYEFIKTDSSGESLEGVKFRLEDEDGNELGIYESDKDGVVSISGMEPGVYIIREIETLKGFTLTGEVIKIKLDEYYVIPEKPRQIVNYTTIQTGVHLAVTGIMWAGIGLMVISGTVGVIRKRRQHRSH